MSLSLRLLWNSSMKFRKCQILCARYSSNEVTNTKSKNELLDITSVDEKPEYAEELSEYNKRVIMEKRNKSRLNNGDRNILNGLPPYNKSFMWYHETIRYKRRMLGRYGIKSLKMEQIGAMWPLEKEIEDRIEYEQALNPKTLQEDWELIAQRNFENSEKIRLREEEVAQKMGKVQQWKEEFYAKIARKEEQLQAAKEKKERLIEDVRRQFGFKIDPRDARFKEALLMKEKEDKKKKKEEKKQQQTNKFMAQLIAESNKLNLEKNKSATKEKTEE